MNLSKCLEQALILLSQVTLQDEATDADVQKYDSFLLRMGSRPNPKMTTTNR